MLSKVIRPLVGKPLHHVQSAKDFVSKVSKVTLLPGECLCSYDVSALFTSVTIDPPLNIIKKVLEKDTSLQDRTVLSVKNIIELLGFVCIILASLSKINSMNRLKEQLCGHW